MSPVKCGLFLITPEFSLYKAGESKEMGLTTGCKSN